MSTQFTLYRPDKYKVLIGQRPDVGFVTCWSEPERVFHKIQHQVGLLSTLYSKFGVNVIFRNLALNPQITKLFIWRHEGLSKTNIGLQGSNLLIDLFAKKDISQISDFNFEEEIDNNIISQILQDVQCFDISDKNIDELAKILEGTKLNKSIATRQSFSFPEPKIDENRTFPSESVGFVVRGKGIFHTWLQVIDKITRYGHNFDSQYGYQHRQLISLTWVIQGEKNLSQIDLSLAKDLPTEIREQIGLSQKSLEEYANEVWLSGDIKEGVTYTYGNRLRSYKYSPQDSALNQIQEFIVKQLQKSKFSRRAFASSIIPPLDVNSSEQPCFVFLQALVEGQTLHLLATFRSHDIYKAGIPNAYGLLKIQEEICTQLGLERGFLKITSESAHIYEQDWKNALFLVKCAIRDTEPKTFFIPEDSADPRGNFLIRLVDNTIQLDLQSPKGETLLSLTGKSTKYLISKLSQLDLFGNISHAMDIAAELTKAEICLNHGLSYQQDRSIQFKQ